ncbi:MAG: DNA replication/repair protein RecF [Candidatus Dormibacteraceae bacterium]
MRLISLSLRNYRNYGRLDFEPNSSLTLCLGLNGQGKTNLLESVSLLALSSSPRTRRESELIGPMGSIAVIRAEIDSGNRRREISISIQFSQEANRNGYKIRKLIEVDGQKCRAVDLPGIFRVSLFWPDDLNLAKSGPEHRRRLLNQILVQIKPGYATTLSRYKRVVEQRNSLLKQIWMRERSVGDLEVWNIEMVKLGGDIVQARSELVADISTKAAAAHSEISGGENLEIDYLGPGDDLDSALAASLDEDLRRGSCSVGPHRDDLRIQINGRDARSFASQGQQRTAVIGIKLGEFAVLYEKTSEPPMLLLDDVLSELDLKRRSALFRYISASGQVLVTATDTDFFPESMIKNSKVYNVYSGELKLCG